MIHRSAVYSSLIVAAIGAVSLIPIGDPMSDIVVKNQAELLTALKNAKGGETIKLLAGNYGTVNINNYNFASTVNIVSADPGSRALLEQLSINGSSNIAVQGLDLIRPASTVETNATLNSVFNSRNISFDDVHIRGALADPTLSSATGLVIRSSAGVTVTNSTFDHIGSGLNVSGSSDIVLKDNSLSELRRDGMILSAVTRVTIDGNMITNMHPAAGDHPDFVQFYTNGTTTASSDITVTNNLFLQGSGEAAQGVFMQDEVGTLPFVNVNISNNLVYTNGLSNGIFVKGGKNVVISSNSAISRTDDTTPVWIFMANVTGGSISNNIADRISTGSNTAVTIGDNSMLEQSGATLRSLGNINDPASVQLADLLIDRVGFHPVLGSVAYDLFVAQKAAAARSSTALATRGHVVLDLKFAADGVTDVSRFHSSRTTAAFNTANVEVAGGTGLYHVSTGQGFEVARSNAMQIFGLSAFTLSFSLQRDSATAGTGQALGIFNSWAVGLLSNGELSFTMKNDKGVTYSIVTNGAKIQDTRSHNIAVTYDQDSKRAVIYVDNVARGQGTVTGTTRGLESWSLYVGNPYGGSLSGKIGNIQLRDVALPAGQIQQTAGSDTADTDPVIGRNPFLTQPLVSAAFTSISDYQRYAPDLAHA